jgi:hypothetical protein
MSNFYKPSYKKQPLKYTNGDEYIIQSSLEPYVGFYTVDSVGTVYSQPEFTNNKREQLISIPTPLSIDNNTSQYFKLTRTDFAKKEQPVYHVLTVTDQDIKRGYVLRYIAQKINEPHIIVEISQDQFKYNVHQEVRINQPGIDTNIWLMNSIHWTIVGVYSDVIKNNRKVLNNAEKYMPGISKYFTDLAEFIQVPVTGPDRIYTDGEPVPMSLPTSYQIRTNKEVPLGQSCANCIFRFGDNCRKWKADVRNNHWCRTWKLGNQ